MTTDTNTRAMDINEKLTSLLGGNPFDIQLIGKTVDRSWGKPWEHDLWCVFLKGHPGMEFNYRTGMGLRKNGKPVKPSLADILYSLHADSYYTEYSLDELAKEMEITVPSKAVEVHAAIHRSAAIFRKAVPAAVREQVEALLQDY